MEGTWNTYLASSGGCTRVSYVHKAHGQLKVWLIGVVNTKRHYLWRSWPSRQQSQDSLAVRSYSQFTQMPTPHDLAIFVPTTTTSTTDGQTEYFTPYAHARWVTNGELASMVKSFGGAAMYDDAFCKCISIHEWIYNVKQLLIRKRQRRHRIINLRTSSETPNGDTQPSPP